MREVIQRVIETEGEAKHMVEAARQEAERLLATAQTEAQAILTRARAETRAQAEKLIDSAVQQAQAEKKQLLAKADLEIREALQLDATTREQIVHAVVQCVCAHD